MIHISFHHPSHHFDLSLLWMREVLEAEEGVARMVQEQEDKLEQVAPEFNNISL